jgi:hypothetical protein
MKRTPTPPPLSTSNRAQIMSFREPRSSAASYHKPVSSRNFLKFVHVTKVQCNASSTSSRDTDDSEEYFRFHQYCGLPGEELDYLRPRQRPLKFTTRNRLSSSPVLTTAHASAVSPSTGSVVIKSSLDRPSVMGWFGKLKAKMRGKHNDHKKSLKTLFDLSQFNKKKMRCGGVSQRNPSSPDPHASDNPSRISSIHSALSSLSRKTKDTFPSITSRIQRKLARPAKVPRSRKETIATRLISPKRKPTTAVTYEAPGLNTVTRSGSHRRNASDGTTVSSFLGSERSDETTQSTSTAPSSAMSASAARASSVAPSINRDMVESKYLLIGTNISAQYINLTPSPVSTIRYAPAGAPRLISIGKSHAAPHSVPPTATTNDDTHVRTKPMGFKRTKQRPLCFRDSSSSTFSSCASSTEMTRNANAGSSVTFDLPVGSHLPVSTPHARIASVSDQLRSGLGLGGSIC